MTLTSSNALSCTISLNNAYYVITLRLSNINCLITYIVKITNGSQTILIMLLTDYSQLCYYIL